MVCTQYCKVLLDQGCEQPVSPVAFAFVIVNIDLEIVTGTNNIKAVRYSDGSTAELEYTYNEKGYPLTVKQKGQSFIKYEFRYRQ
jgi:hypothetical protein